MTDEMVNINFQLSVPSDNIISIANSLLLSETQDQRDVAKALIDTTEISIKAKDAITNCVTQDVDLHFYFDHWIGDAVDAAKRLLSSDNANDRNIAQSLLDQEKAIIASKESFMSEVKRVSG